MVQTFNPAKVMLADTVGKEITNNLLPVHYLSLYPPELL